MSRNRNDPKAKGVNAYYTPKTHKQLDKLRADIGERSLSSTQERVMETVLNEPSMRQKLVRRLKYRP